MASPRERSWMRISWLVWVMIFFFLSSAGNAKAAGVIATGWYGWECDKALIPALNVPGINCCDSECRDSSTMCQGDYQVICGQYTDWVCFGWPGETDRDVGTRYCPYGCYPEISETRTYCAQTDLCIGIPSEDQCIQDERRCGKLNIDGKATSVSFWCSKQDRQGKDCFLWTRTEEFAEICPYGCSPAGTCFTADQAYLSECTAQSPSVCRGGGVSFCEVDENNIGRYPDIPNGAPCPYGCRNGMCVNEEGEVTTDERCAAGDTQCGKSPATEDWVQECVRGIDGKYGWENVIHCPAGCHAGACPSEFIDDPEQDCQIGERKCGGKSNNMLYTCQANSVTGVNEFSMVEVCASGTCIANPEAQCAIQVKGGYMWEIGTTMFNGTISMFEGPQGLATDGRYFYVGAYVRVDGVNDLEAALIRLTMNGTYVDYVLLDVEDADYIIGDMQYMEDNHIAALLYNDTVGGPDHYFIVDLHPDGTNRSGSAEFTVDTTTRHYMGGCGYSAENDTYYVINYSLAVAQEGLEIYDGDYNYLDTICLVGGGTSVCADDVHEDGWHLWVEVNDDRERIYVIHYDGTYYYLQEYKMNGYYLGDTQLTYYDDMSIAGISIFNDNLFILYSKRAQRSGTYQTYLYMQRMSLQTICVSDCHEGGSICAPFGHYIMHCYEESPNCWKYYEPGLFEEINWSLYELCSGTGLRCEERWINHKIKVAECVEFECIECTLGEWECANDNVRRQCVSREYNVQGDYCSMWALPSDWEPCGVGAKCINGQCVEHDECTDGDSRCWADNIKDKAKGWTGNFDEGTIGKVIGESFIVHCTNWTGRKLAWDFRNVTPCQYGCWEANITSSHLHSAECIEITTTVAGTQRAVAEIDNWLFSQMFGSWWLRAIFGMVIVLAVTAILGRLNGEMGLAGGIISTMMLSAVNILPWPLLVFGLIFAGFIIWRRVFNE
jgi:hypothetical protein